MTGGCRDLWDRHELIESSNLIREHARLDLAALWRENSIGRGQFYGKVNALAEYINLCLDRVKVVCHRSRVSTLQRLLKEKHYYWIDGKINLLLPYKFVGNEIPTLLIDQVIVDSIFDDISALFLIHLLESRIGEPISKR